MGKPRRTATSRITPARAQVQAKRVEALQLRAAGLTYQQIANAIGVGLSTTYNYVITEVQTAARDDAKKLLHLDLVRLDALQRAEWPAAIQGDHQAVNTVIRIIELRQRLVGNMQPASLTVNQNVAQLTPEGSVLVIQGRSEQEYIEGLQQARGELPPPDHSGNGHKHV
jgi:hypothetical protein